MVFKANKVEKAFSPTMPGKTNYSEQMNSIEHHSSQCYNVYLSSNLRCPENGIHEDKQKTIPKNATGCARHLKVLVRSRIFKTKYGQYHI